MPAPPPQTVGWVTGKRKQLPKRTCYSQQTCRRKYISPYKDQRSPLLLLALHFHPNCVLGWPGEARGEDSGSHRVRWWGRLAWGPSAGWESSEKLLSMTSRSDFHPSKLVKPWKKQHFQGKKQQLLGKARIFNAKTNTAGLLCWSSWNSWGLNAPSLRRRRSQRRRSRPASDLERHQWDGDLVRVEDMLLV